PEPWCVVASNGVIDAVAIGHRCVLQDGGVRGPGVLHVEIDLASGDGLVADERAAEVEAACHREPGAPLDLLRHDLPQQVGLGEVLRADHDPVAMSAADESEAPREYERECASREDD